MYKYATHGTRTAVKSYLIILSGTTSWQPSGVQEAVPNKGDTNSPMD